MNAKSIVYADPAKGGAAGVYFAHVVDRLGIVMSKTILVPGAQAADMVASGEAEIGVGQTSEIVPVAGAQVLVRCRENLPVRQSSPEEYAPSEDPDAAKSFLQFLGGPVASRSSTQKASTPDDGE